MQKKTNKAQTYLAIDIGGHSIKCAVGIYSQGKLKVHSAFIERLPVESYENGLIKDAVAVEAALKNVLKRQKTREKKAVVTIESSEIIKREILVPKVEQADLVDLITYEVGQYLPIDVNNYVIQYKILGEEKQNDKDLYQILIGAMPKDMAKQHYDLLTTCGLEPVAMDVHTNAVTKLVEVLQSGMTFSSKKSVAYIDFGYYRTDVNIFEGSKNKLNRIIRIGMHSVDVSNANDLMIDMAEAEQKRLELSSESLVSIKKAYDAYLNLKSTQISETQSEDEETAVKVEPAQVNTISRPVYNQIDLLFEALEEVDKVFKFYQSRSVDSRIDQIVVYGGGVLSKDFARFVQDRLDISCALLDFTKYDVIQLKNVDDAPLKYVNAFGALIRQ